MRHVIVLFSLLAFLLFSTETLLAQQQKPNSLPISEHFCAQEAAMKGAFLHNPALRLKHNQAEEALYNFLKSPKLNIKKQPPMYVLPVVVHVIHNNGAENLSDATVLQGIQDLNDAFANIGYYDPATGLDTKVQFCLAKRDPNGNATTGITRTASTMTDMELETMDIPVKNLSRWEPTQYINIWLVKEICSSAYGCGVAGYAYLPSSHGNPEDGIVMEAEFFGSSQGASGVQIHEMGHYLGLYHTFQGGCSNDDCLANGDRVCDTPPDQSTAAVPCGAAANSCSTDTDSGFATDQNDLVEDYMDYGDFNCWSVFTQGQTERMHWFIQNIRPSLLESEACVDPCTSALTAAFNASSLSINVGTTVGFTNAAINSTSADWTVNGTSFSTSTNASYTFNTVGSFEVCLSVGNADPNCSDETCKTITVNCPVVADFTTSNLYPAPGQPVIFSPGSTSATSYNWKVNGMTAGSANNFSYTFPNPGLNTVCLTAGNGLCSATFCQNLFVFQAVGSGECEGSYLKIIGEANEIETAYCIAATPDGNLILGGSNSTNSILAMINPAGDLLWQRSFDLTPGNDFIYALMIDSDGMLVANGRDQLNTNTINFTFRYDYQNNTMLWTRYMPDPSYSRSEVMLQKPSSGNIVLLGFVQSPNTSLDNTYIELDKNTGALVNLKIFDSGTGGTTDAFWGGKMLGNEMYLVGTARYGGGLDKIRPLFSKLDANGNQLWTKTYLRSHNVNARIYAKDIFIENGNTVIYGHGSLNNDNTSDYGLQLYSTNNNGDLLWAKNYDLAGTNSSIARSFMALPDGFLLHGFHNSSAGLQDMHMIRTDKLGNVLWAKTIGGNNNEVGWQAIYNNGFIYLTGTSNDNSPTDNIIFGKMTLDGEIAGPGCDFIHDINVTVTNITNPYDEQHNLTPILDPYPQNIGNNAAVVPINLPFNDLSGCACEVFAPACDTSFLRTYGTLLGDERSQAIVEIPTALGGGFLLGGGKLDSAMMTRLDISGNIVWTRSFDATSQGPVDVPDFITDLIFDSDNNVIGCGQTRDEPDNNVEGFVFKYNIATNNILWVNELNLNDPALEGYTSIAEKSPGGNYIVSGTINEALGTSINGENGTILEINRNTGNNVWQHNYTLGSSESFQKTLVHNGTIYTTGRYNFDGGGTARMRPGISKFDLNGVQQWSKLYLRAVNSGTNARLYSTDMVVDNGLVVLGQGDNTGTSTTNVTPLLFKTDFDGNLLWAMNYDIPGANTEVSTKLLNLPDGYLCLGYYTTSSQDVFLFKTNKQGQLQWSKSYGNDATEDAFDMVYANGQIYFTGKTKAATSGASFDLYFANIGVDGTANALDSCNLFSDLTMTSAPYTNPYNAQHNLTDLNQNWANFLDDYVVSETAVQTTIACFQPCLDSCDVVPDAFFQNATATCLGDSLLVSLSLCNLGNFDLPTGTPIRFYLGNPTSTSATAVGSYMLPQNLAKDSCGTFSFTILAAPNTTIYAMVNDDGTTPTPFSLTDFEADTEECNYENNLGSFFFSFTAPTLELGPDISSCQTGVNTLDAGPGFASYHWQDGSIEQTLTAFAEGTYSVTVTDACGGTQSDVVHITTNPATILDLGPDFLICGGGSHDFNVPGYTTYEWSPADYLSCTNCPNPTTTPTAAITYTLVATSADGCIGVDSVHISLGATVESIEDLLICEGDTAFVFGMPVTTTGQFSQTFTSQSGCDSIRTISVGVLPVIESISDAVLCAGDTLLVFGMPVTTSGQFSQTFTAVTGCDSIVTISVGVLPVVESISDAVLCAGDTLLVFGMPVTTSGQFSQTFTAASGCDSIVTISVGVLNPVFTQENRTICLGATTDIFGTPTGTAGTYSMTYTGINGCDSTHTIVLNVNAISLAFSTVNISCNALGSVSATTVGGIGTLHYLWSNGATTQSISNLAAGNYSLTVTDDSGCSATAITSITGALGPNTGIAIISPVTEDEPDGGELAASAFGGTSPFVFVWSNGETTAQIDSLSSGTYTVTVTDANGCTASASANLFVPACTGGKIWNDTNRDGCQDPGETGIGNVMLMLSGSTAFGQTVADTTLSAINGEYIFEGLAPGNYFVKIKLPTGLALSQPNACGAHELDSDFSTTTLVSSVVVLVEGHCCLTVDGGLFDACLNLTSTGEICCDQTLCGPGNDPAPITSIAPAGGGGGATQYLWMYSTVGGPMGANWAAIPGATSASYDPGPLAQTTHFVRCAKSATCSQWLESNFVTITVEDEAVAHINSPGPICVNDPVVFSAAPNAPGASYNWNFGPWATPSTSNQASVDVTFGQAGVTNITLTVTYSDCTSSDAMSVTVSDNPTYCNQAIIGGVGNGNAAIAQPVLADGQFQVFPNPFSGSLTVTWGAQIESEVSVKLYSVEGRLLHSSKSSADPMQYVGDFGNLLPGVYLLHLQAVDGEPTVFRVVKD